MNQHNYTIYDREKLKSILHSDEINANLKSHAQLIQIYSANNTAEWYKSIGVAIREVFPLAVIVGASSVGEINEGVIHTDSTVVLFSFFDSSSVKVLSYNCPSGDEVLIGASLFRDLSNLTIDVKGLLLLSTTVSTDSSQLFNSLTSNEITYPIFGGGASDYANQRKTLVFDGTDSFQEGVVAVAFSGENLDITVQTYLGWHPLSKEMTITEVEGMSVKTIDNKPSFLFYEKYLGLEIQNSFFQNVLEFPFLLYRNGQIIARVPFFVNEKDYSIQFLADIHLGEKFRIGYGNPQTIINESISIQKEIKAFNPDAIFLFTCICRRFLMQNEVNRETEPFNAIAPTAGFYTFGEFFADKNKKSLLNSTMVAVGMKERNKNVTKTHYAETKNSENKETKEISDPYENQHNRIISRLLYFINVTIQEVEAQNILLKKLIDQKNEFLGIAAHDLRNPIGAIQGISELLEEQVDERHVKHIKLINKASTSMLSLINNLLDLAQIEAGKLTLDKTESDYIAFILQNIMLNEFIASSKKIKLVADISIRSQLLFFDIERINQVLNNLIGNAIKYSFPDTIITIKVFIKNNLITTQIIDQGQGISTNELASIFLPFKRTSTKPTAGENSHGLGLAIVKRIIEGHNGTVKVTSELNKGSVFQFTLPLL